MLVVKFCCHKCGIERCEVEVRYRRTKEPIEKFVEHVIVRAVSRAHRKKSPHCLARKIDNLLIPLPKPEDGDIGIGMKPLTGN